jgi:sulfofructose kinase
MSDVWVLGTASWDRIYEIDAIPATGGQATARHLGRRPGGATGNIARALGSAGHRVHLLAQVGADSLGDDLLAELRTWPVATEAMVRHDRCTPETLIFVNPDRERTIVVLEKPCAATVAVPGAQLAVADGIFVGRYGDYDPELPELLRQSPALVMTSVPFPPDAPDWYAHVVVGSRSEYPAEWLADPYEQLSRRVGRQLQWVIVTEGVDGAAIHGPDGVRRIARVDAAVVRDTTGAGDSFAAGVLHGLLQKIDVATAARLGACWAAAAVALAQSTPPRWAELGLGDPAGEWASQVADTPERPQP